METNISKNESKVELALAQYRTMLTIRFFELAASKARLEGAVRGSVHPYIGQEAIAVGICSALRPDDYIASYHRGHGHAIAKGADPVRMMMELYGRKPGTCFGKGGSMHIADLSVGMLGANGVIGDGVTMSIGAAHAFRLLGKDSVVVAFFGDGGLNRGPVLESLNWAKAFMLPVLFACEDNMYSYTQLTRSVTGGPGPAARAAGFGLHAETVDGNDVFRVYEAVRGMASEMRRGGGPMFLHAMTYRLAGHIATDAGHYRDASEIARFQPLDPLTRCESWLIHNGLDQSEIERERRAAEQFIDDAVRQAEAAPFPSATEAFSDVQDLGGPVWQ